MVIDNMTINSTAINRLELYSDLPDDDYNGEEGVDIDYYDDDDEIIDPVEDPDSK